MKYCKLLIFLSLMLPILIGCSNSSTEPEPPETIDRIYGIYYLNGPRLTIEDPCFHCPAGEDTLKEHVSFSLIVREDHDNPERIQFYGLQGADTGDMDKRVFPECTRSADCEIFGDIISGRAFEIDIENNGHRYQASGYIRRSIDIELQGQYSYDNITIDYDLSGKWVSFRLD